MSDYTKLITEAHFRAYRSVPLPHKAGEMTDRELLVALADSLEQAQARIAELEAERQIPGYPYVNNKEQH